MKKKFPIHACLIFIVLWGSVISVKAQCVDCAQREPETKTTLFPNPATNVVNVAFDRYACRTVELVSVLGVVQKKIVEVYSDRLQIDIGNLPKGVYFLAVYVSNILVGTKKFVVL